MITLMAFWHKVLRLSVGVGHMGMAQDNRVQNVHPATELPRLLAEEALAECEVTAHQVHHGLSAEALLSCCPVSCL